MKNGTNLRVRSNVLLYAVMFLLAAASLVFEMLSIRSASVAFGTGFQLTIVPLTLLGIGLGGAFASWRKDRTWRRDTVAALVLFPAATTLALFTIHSAPGAGLQAFSMAAFFFETLLAFVGTGAAAALILTYRSNALAKLYSFDLVGGASGVALALMLLNWAGYEQTAFMLLALSSLPLCVFSMDAFPASRSLAVLGMAGMILGVGALSVYAPRSAGLICPGVTSLSTRSNAYSQVDAIPTVLANVREEWGNDARVAGSQRAVILTIDCGKIMTPVLVLPQSADASFLNASLRSVPFAFMTRTYGSLGNVLVTGSGGGMDVARAWFFGASHVDAVEINPLIIDLARTYASTSDPYAHAGVYEDDLRRYLETSTSTYDVIMAVKTKTVGAPFGNPQYGVTTEAVREYLQHLRPNGVFVTSSGNFYPDATLRSVLATVFAGLQMNGQQTDRHVIVVNGSAGIEDLVLVRNEPFTDSDIETVSTAAGQRGFSSVHVMREADTGTLVSQDLVVTDSRPFSLIDRMLVGGGSAGWGFLAAGTLAALFTIVMLLLPVVATESRPGNAIGLIASGVYFAAIGFGFVGFEIAGILSMSLPIADPGYAPGVAIGSLLFFGGLGSRFAGSLRGRATSWVAVSAAALVLMFVLAFLLSSAYVDLVIVEVLWARIAIGIVTLAPAGFVLGMFFPLGVSRVVDAGLSNFIPWAWAIDGVASVAGGLLSLAVAFAYGLVFVPIISALAYTLAALVLTRVRKTCDTIKP